MEGHAEDLKRYRFSNNTADSCRTVCRVCGKAFPLQRMRSHTKTDHQMQITEYKAKFCQRGFYDIIEKVFHR